MDNVIPPPGSIPGADAAALPQHVDAGYGANLGSDVAGFAASLERAAAPGEASEMARAMFAPLEHINTEAAGLADFAREAAASGNELTPGEIVSLTARSQEFMFHAQLTSNIANRTADGLQQLFRQQS